MVSTRSDRSYTDAKCAEGMGIATTNESARIAASKGLMDYAQTKFDTHQGVMNAGVLLALPALCAQGLSKAFTTYDDLPRGYYGLHHIILLFCFMSLCRIKNIEQLKGYPPGELGKLLGLDRVPEVGHLRKKFSQIFRQEKTDEFHNKLFSGWVSKMPELYFYIDGHVRVYHGDKANLSKRYVSREKLCLNGTTEFWVNDHQGDPLMVITGELNEKLKQGVEQIVESLKEEIPVPKEKGRPRFTIVIDRESYEPKWYNSLWNDHDVAVITYRKNVKDKWEEEQFETSVNTMMNNKVTRLICERGTLLNGYWFREIRSLGISGHQTSIITTHPQIDKSEVAIKMFARWTQENYFKYMIENFDFDKMIEYGTEKIDSKTELVNPEYRKKSYEIKKTREKKRRREAKVYGKIKAQEHKTIDEAEQQIAKSSKLIQEIDSLNKEIDQLIKQRKEMPARITVADMPIEKRYEKLKVESKKFKNAIIMLAYRAETAMYNTLMPVFKNAHKEGRALLREIYSSDADLVVDQNNKKLNVIIHSLSTPRANQALEQLCIQMNLTQTIYPKTDLVLVFKSVAQ